MSREFKGLLITLGIFSTILLIVWSILNWPEMSMKIAVTLSMFFLFWIMYKFVMMFVPYGKNDKKQETKKDEYIGKKW